MFEKNEPDLNNQLDRLGEQMVRNSALTPQEIDDQITAAFLYTRVRANIAAQQQRSSPWLAIIELGRYAMLALSVVVLALFSLYWSMSRYNARPNNLAAINTFSRQAPALVCTACKEDAITGSGCSVSNFETLTSIFIRDEQGEKR
jgi:hypothetical protein